MFCPRIQWDNPPLFRLKSRKPIYCFTMSAPRARKMAEKKPRFISAPVLAVISLMFFVYYATVFVFLEEWMGLDTPARILNTIFFSWFAFMCLISFFVAALTDPGTVPSSFAPESEDPQKDILTARYCEKCCAYKPPRAHHCRACRRCVLKMDHHCVWLSACVGYKNYKPFIAFVLHAALGSIYSMVIFMGGLMHKDHNLGTNLRRLFYVLSGIVMAGLSLSLSSLFGWHMYLLAHNMTTIEYREGVRAKWLAEKNGQQYRHRFDLGVFQNFLLILGPNMLKWFCPTALAHLDDGTKFPISNG